MIDRNHTTPVMMVSRSRLRSTTEDPPSELETPPPNRFDRPPPLPRCDHLEGPEHAARLTGAGHQRARTATVARSASPDRFDQRNAETR